MCGRPPLRIRRAGETFVIDVQTLGEYKTSVARVRLSRGRDVVWEVKAHDRIPQLHTFQLRVGNNPSVPQECGGGVTTCEGSRPSNGFAVIVPAKASSFTLEPGTKYLIEVWGGESWWSRVTATLRP